MRVEKQLITQEYTRRLNASPFFLVLDYRGLTVHQFSELRRRLDATSSKIHVVKNSLFRLAVKEAGIGDLSGTLDGQLAVVTGERDVSAAAKIVKNFHAEFEKPSVKFGFIRNDRIDASQILALADLPSIDVLRARLLGLFQAPATRLVRVLSEPAASLARVLNARAKQDA